MREIMNTHTKREREREICKKAKCFTIGRCQKSFDRLQSVVINDGKILSLIGHIKSYSTIQKNTLRWYQYKYVNIKVKSKWMRKIERANEPTREREKKTNDDAWWIFIFFRSFFSFQLNNNIIKIWKSNWRIDRFRPVHRWQHMKWSLNGQTMTRATTTTITTFKMVSIKSINAAWYRVGTTDSTYNQTFFSQRNENLIPESALFNNSQINHTYTLKWILFSLKFPIWLLSIESTIFLLCSFYLIRIWKILRVGEYIIFLYNNAHTRTMNGINVCYVVEQIIIASG